MALFFSLFISAFFSIAPSGQSGEEFIQMLYKKYNGVWYNDFTFTQTTETYRNDTLIKTETWYENGILPDKFRIDFGDQSQGNFVIYRNDSLFSYRSGVLKRSMEQDNDLLFLLGGMYFYDYTEVKKRLIKYGFDIKKGHETIFNGKKVFVVGAGSEEEVTNQLWYDSEKHVLLRMIRYDGNQKEDVIFEGHQPVGKAWIESKIRFYRNGKLLQVEHYHDFRSNNKVPLKLFYPQIAEPAAKTVEAPQINIRDMKWLPNSHQFWTKDADGIYLGDAGNLETKNLILSASDIKSSGLNSAVEDMVWSDDLKKVLIYTNSAKVWRANTKGDYWMFDLKSKKGKRLGQGFDPSSTQFAKFSPDGNQVAYVYKHNIYVENIASGKRKQLTKDGSTGIINGTFDWAYEEELGARDGFKWSPDSKNIAFWRVDASKVKKFKMLNNTDGKYPIVTEIEYPKTGENPSDVRIGIVGIASAKTVWMGIPGASDNNYIPRISWAGNNEIMVMQLNREQNHGNFYLCDIKSGKANKVYEEHQENGWIAPFNVFAWDDPWWIWIDDNQSFLRAHEKDGWLRISKISRDGKTQEIITKGNYDANMLAFDAKNKTIYFEASPYDATERYLYKIQVDKGDSMRVTPRKFDGTNGYVFSPDGQYALHSFKNIQTLTNYRLVNLPDHTKVYPLTEDEFRKPNVNYDLEKFSVTTIDGVDISGIMAKPKDFDPAKKYPVFFFTYGEPASTVANDAPTFNSFGAQLVPKGYIGIAMDNRGTPSLKGTAYRMAVYKKLGIVNARDQAMAAKEVFKWPFIDTSRVVVHGWSGGGNMTLNLMFRYPEIYKTGIAVASISDQHLYDNIYMERFMGTPQENEEAYVASSPVTFAKNLQGNLLVIHGTGDDNVHYQNAELLINELVKHGKLFEFMAYPNRTHGIYEGQGTSQHLTKTIIDFIERKSPPGAR